MITSSVEISRPPKEVFDYIDQLARHPEWQANLVDVTVQGDGPTGVGTRASETRKGLGGGNVTIEITEHDPPWRMAFQGVEGPIRPSGKVRVLPLDGLTRSRLQLEIDFEGVGIGKLLLPLVRSMAAKQIPKDQATLKAKLEAGA